MTFVDYCLIALITIEAYRAFGERRIISELRKLRRELKQTIMATSQEVRNAITALNDSVTTEMSEVAAKIQALIDQIGTGSSTAAENAEYVASLTDIKARVEGFVVPDTPADPNA